MPLSRTFKTTLALADEPAYRIAWRAGLHPTTLSKLLHGAERLKPGDRRIVAVGRELGLAPEECFAAADSQHAA